MLETIGTDIVFPSSSSPKIICTMFSLTTSPQRIHKPYFRPTMCLYANYVPAIYANYICQLCAYMYTTMCRCNRTLWGAADFMGPQLIIFAIAFSWPWTFTSGHKCWVLPRPRNHLLGLLGINIHQPRDMSD